MLQTLSAAAAAAATGSLHIKCQLPNGRAMYIARVNAVCKGVLTCYICIAVMADNDHAMCFDKLLHVEGL